MRADDPKTPDTRSIDNFGEPLLSETVLPRAFEMQMNILHRQPPNRLQSDLNTHTEHRQMKVKLTCDYYKHTMQNKHTDNPLNLEPTAETPPT